jgi:hypothetical protein
VIVAEQEGDDGEGAEQHGTVPVSAGTLNSAAIRPIAASFGRKPRGGNSPGGGAV